MEETSSYPPIEPTNFDLIVVGTGLPESILSAAASAAGKTVLHLDPNPFYGTHYTSLPLNDLVSFLESQSECRSQSQSQFQQSETSDGYASTPLILCPLYSGLQVNAYSSEPVDESRKFNLDLSGPRVLLNADSMTDLILKVGINQYMEFKSIDACFISDAQGSLEKVPDSRSAIFKDQRFLTLTERYQLNEFFKLVRGHFETENEEGRIPEEDLESPLVEFLSKKGLSGKLKSVILYTLVHANYDQDSSELRKHAITTRHGINRLAVYHSSIGRFPNANGAMIYPIYGQGELPQSFCRRAAVKGCIHVLRMPVVAVLMDKDGGTYKGVKLVSGQEIFSSKLILAPSFTISSPLSTVSLRDAGEKVIRGICIAKDSIKPGVANCLVFFHPRSLHSEQRASVRVLQLSGNVAAGPSGMFVSYLSATCDNVLEGKKLLTAAIDALFSVPGSRNSVQSGTNVSCEEGTGAKPCLIWSALFMQELATFHETFDSISYTIMPDEHLHYDNILDATENLFKEIYPSEGGLFVNTSLSDEHLDDAGPELDS